MTVNKKALVFRQGLNREKFIKNRRDILRRIPAPDRFAAPSAVPIVPDDWSNG